jgi:Tol biopolymer transport system component
MDRICGIAFDSNRDGDDDIYVMDADGGNVRQLTDDPAMDWWPDWSPVP